LAGLENEVLSRSPVRSPSPVPRPWTPLPRWATAWVGQVSPVRPTPDGLVPSPPPRTGSALIPPGLLHPRLLHSTPTHPALLL
jgi:hypothetical protein